MTRYRPREGPLRVLVGKERFSENRLWSQMPLHPLPGRAIRAGAFGLIQQFGVGVDNIDLDAAAAEGVGVANMPGLNAVPRNAGRG